MTTWAALARDVGVLWDEAQDRPRLLRFLAPFGRPDLARLERVLREATSERDVLAEPHPAFATWLAALRFRSQPGERTTVDELVPQGRTLLGSLEVRADLVIGENTTLVVAGHLRARIIDVRGVLVVAGDVEAQVLVADGCTLVGGDLRAAFVSAPATRLNVRVERRRVTAPQAFQVAGAVKAKVFDSARLGTGGPVEAEVLIHAIGAAPTEQWEQRLRSLLLEPALVHGGRLDFDGIRRRVERGQPVLRSA